MDKQNEQADKPGPYVDIDALNKGDAKVIEKTASDWPKLNQRQRDKIRHNIQKPVYDAIVTMAKNNLAATINISEITHDASKESSNRASSSHKHYFDSDKLKSEKREFSEKADRQHEREQRRFQEQHKEEQSTLKYIAKTTATAVGLVSLAVIAAIGITKSTN